MEIDFSELDDKYKSSPERWQELQRCLKRKIDELTKKMHSKVIASLPVYSTLLNFFILTKCIYVE